MLSYRHSFHAGNHADVLKHTVQSLIIESLKEKSRSCIWIPTRARAVISSAANMPSAPANTEGIGLLWQRDDLPEELAAYMSVVHNFNRSGTLRYYPGSPLIARQLLRPQDKIHLTELHPSDYPLLRSEFQKDERAKVQRADGYQQLKSQLPPLSRRG